MNEPKKFRIHWLTRRGNGKSFHDLSPWIEGAKYVKKKLENIATVQYIEKS